MFPHDYVFVLATTAYFYKSLRAVIESIQSTFPGIYPKTIVYDLGELYDNEDMVRT